MSRKLNRSMLKVQYLRFCEAWTNERRYQDYLKAQGKDLPEGHAPLGKKPAFSMWLDAVKNKKIAAQAGEAPPAVVEAQESEKKVEVVNTEW